MTNSQPSQSPSSAPTPQRQEPERQEPESQEPESQGPERQEPESQEPESQGPERQEPESQEPLSNQVVQQNSVQAQANGRDSNGSHEEPTNDVEEEPFSLIDGSSLAHCKVERNRKQRIATSIQKLADMLQLKEIDSKKLVR